MAYVLIPEGFTLKKVSKAEERAVDQHFGRETRSSYLSDFLGNPNTPIVFGVPLVGIVTAYIAKRAAEDVLDLCNAPEAVRESALKAVGGAKFASNIIGQLITEGKVFVEGAPTTVTLEQLQTELESRLGLN
jgi:hypothetical protein